MYLDFVGSELIVKVFLLLREYGTCFLVVELLHRAINCRQKHTNAIRQADLPLAAIVAHERALFLVVVILLCIILLYNAVSFLGLSQVRFFLWRFEVGVIKFYIRTVSVYY